MNNAQHSTFNIQRARLVGQGPLVCWRLGFTRLGLCALAGLTCLSLLVSAADIASFGKGKNVKYNDFFDPPNQTKIRAHVEASEAVPEGPTRYRLKNVHVESFKVDSHRESIIDAPDCVYDIESRTISSSGAINAQTADGRWKIAGTGFSLSLTNKSLTISNNVRTVIRDLGTITQEP